MATVVAENVPAEVSEILDSTGKAIEQTATFSVPFEAARAIVEAAPPPQRPSRNMPIHDPSEEIEAWDAASDEALAVFEDSLEE